MLRKGLNLIRNLYTKPGDLNIESLIVYVQRFCRIPASTKYPGTEWNMCRPDACGGTRDWTSRTVSPMNLRKHVLRYTQWTPSLLVSRFHVRLNDICRILELRPWPTTGEFVLL